MASADKDKWTETVKEEYDCMSKFKVFQAVPMTNRRGKWPVYRLKFGCEAPKWCPMATFSLEKLQFKKI